MMIFLLSLLLCWDTSLEPDFSHYRVRFAERYIVEWVPCPPPVEYTFCPVYSSFTWAWHSMLEPLFDSPPCAEGVGEFCFSDNGG